MAVVSTALLGAGAPALAQRSLGIDVSIYQESISSANWATLKRATNAQVGGVYGDGRDFVMIRSSRGGTTGQDHRQGGYPSGDTFYNLSQRYDDPNYVQNITLATAAGVFAGPYHFVRPDIIASTTNSDGTTVGVANNGTDEANHFIQMAGPWMRPGYLLPACDLEVGAGLQDLTAFCTNFSAQIYAVMGIRPMMYINGNYADNYVLSPIVSYFPNLWIARWPTTVNPQTNNPSDSVSWVYGVWNPDYPTIPTPIPQPWKFWQYTGGTGRVNALGGGTTSVDLDVAQGGLEFVKDYLVPALWVTNSSGQWTTLLNWNGGQTPTAPPQATGQLTPAATGPLPTPSLPGTNDTVILDVPGANVTVTLASGAQTIRKLYMRETLNITGGSLTINYIPSWDSTPIAAQFSGPVTLSGSASLSVHTLQVDATNTFTLNGGSLTFNTINLMPNTNRATPARIAMGGDVNFNALTNATATITNGAGSGTFGWIDLGGATHAFNVTNGVGLFVYVPITNGALAKTGLGTMCLGATNPYSGGTIISSGTLALTNSGAINSSSQLSLAAGATFDVSALASPYNLSSSTSLSASGTGTTVGSTAAAIKGASGGTVNLGSRPITLTYDGSHPALYISQGTLQLQGNAWTVNASSALAAGAYTIAQQAGGNIISSSGTPTVSGTAIGSGKTASIQVSGANVNLVILENTTTALSRTTGSSSQTYGGTLTFTATVTGNGTTPGGNVIFKDGSTPLATNALSSGTAVYTSDTALNVSGSPHSLAAYYQGDSTHNTSDSSASPISQIITAQALTAGLTGTVSKTYDGTTAATLAAGNYTLPGVVSGDTVTLNNPTSGTYDTKNVGSGKTVSVTGLAISGLSAGNYTLSSTSTSGVIGVITALTTSCWLTSSVNPSGPGTNVTFTAVVNGVPPAADLPTGNVVFSANGAPLATNALVGGGISASTASLPLGTNALMAQYLGDGNFLGSTASVAQVVQALVAPGPTNTILGIVDNSDGTFTLTFVGTPQAQYYVVAYSDLTAPMSSWVPLAGSTNTVTNTSGLWFYTVTNTATQQFYRSAAVPGP
jgi:autotransporter-associated beta strand protein